MVFIVFFKVFFLTVLVGMFHGLVYLPVMLAVFGSDRIPQKGSTLKGFIDLIWLDLRPYAGPQT